MTDYILKLTWFESASEIISSTSSSVNLSPKCIMQCLNSVLLMYPSPLRSKTLYKTKGKRSELQKSKHRKSESLRKSIKSLSKHQNVKNLYICLQIFQDIFGTKVTGILVNIVFSILSIFQVKLPAKYQKK